jgi:metallo-beta-lactamase class B
VIGNIYYVGASGVTSFLITSPSGHILLDSGFKETVPLIKDNIHELGFKLKDIRILINSHAHYDHAGGLAVLKGLTGAELMVSEADALLMSNGGRGDSQWGDRFSYQPVKADRILRDKDKVELGGAAMIARLTPGHTKGNTTWTMKVTEADREYDVVFAGSTSAPGYKLINNEKYTNITDDYAYTFNLLKTLPCDVFLGPHGEIFLLEEKMKKLERGENPNPFVDPVGYRRFIEESEKNYKEHIEKQQGGE